MYVAKCFNKPYRTKPLGEKSKLWEKILIGFGLTMLVIAMIAGPLLLFSSINPLKVQIYGIPEFVQMSLNVVQSGATYQTPIFVSSKMV
jgi:hypothetical protein